MTRRRIERVNHLLREELASLLLRSAKDPRLAGVSIMAVQATPDLKYATVYVRAGGGEVEIEEAIRGLQSAEGFLRRELGRRLHIRRIPEFTWEPDRTIEHAHRIESLLQEVRPTLAESEPAAPVEEAEPGESEDGHST